MTLQEHLTSELARKVQAHGLVIWLDEEREYAEVAEQVVPDGTRFEAFDGSWYELRQRIEDAMAGDAPPVLVVYGPAAPPDDPLAEVRDTGATFKLRLATLIRQALRGELTETRIQEIARQARTIGVAEAAIMGEGQADARLIEVLGSADSARMLVTVLSGTAEDQIEEADAWDAIADLCRDFLSADVTGRADELRDALFRHLLLGELAHSSEGGLPSALATGWIEPPAAELRRGVDVLERLRSKPEGMPTYRALAERADTALALAEHLTWSDGFAGVAGTPAVESVALNEAIRRLGLGDFEAAAAIARARLENSVWVADPTLGLGSAWRATEAISHLQMELSSMNVPSATPGELLTWYVNEGWRVDRAHRRLELARTALLTFGELEDALTSARAAYDSWLDQLLTRFTGGMEEAALDISDLLRQGEVHDRFVGATDARTAYVWVDALRYELGVDLADALRTVGEKVELHAAVAAAPTITPVGMANLLPGAAASLVVALDGNDRVKVSVAGIDVAGVPQRRDMLRARHGSLADLDLNDAAQKGERALADAIGDANLVLVRSQEVDAAGESGMLSVAWSHFETVNNLLASVVARLAQAGVERVVVSADHGFIALGQDLGSQRVVDAPSGGVGTLKRRAFIGHSGTPSPATVRVPLAACGVTSDLDLVVPRGLAVLKAGGGRQFFHGGLSPQELVVPVIVVELGVAAEPQKLRVNVQVAGGRITTGVFAATLTFSGDLFTDTVTVRVVAAGAGGGEPIARIVSGDGLDPATGAVTIDGEHPSVLTFQVTGNLEAGSQVEVQVLDARTGVRVADVLAEVAAPITVEDDLD